MERQGGGSLNKELEFEIMALWKARGIVEGKGVEV